MVTSGEAKTRLPKRPLFVMMQTISDHLQSRRNKVGNNVSLSQFIDILRSSTLAERRPIHNEVVMQAMLDHADVIVSALTKNKIVGIATCLTDFHRVAYLADLAVHADYQREGIGKQLIAKTQQTLKSTCKIILLSAPKANEYYPKLALNPTPRMDIGWQKKNLTEGSFAIK